MKISKDLYEYLAEFTDDKTIVKMLSVNKKFNNSVFFQRIFNKKYPLLINFKKDNQTQKDFYLSMVKYISKLEEEFSIPYIPCKDYNPQYFYYENHKDGYNIYDCAIRYAALGGNMEIVKLMIEKGATDFNETMYHTAKRGHIEIVKLMIEKGATDFNFCMYGAARFGNMDILKLMIEKGATNFNWALNRASYGGHTEIVEYLKKLIK